MYVESVNWCSWDPSMSNSNRPRSRGLSHWHMSKPLMYEPISLCFNAFKWSCESNRTSPISEPAVRAQSHLLPWWKERVHRKWNWKSIRRTRMYTHTHKHTALLFTNSLLHTHTESHTHRGSYLTFQSIIIITDVWWAGAWCRKLIQAKNRFSRVIELQSKNYESERSKDCTQYKGILTLNLIKVPFFSLADSSNHVSFKSWSQPYWLDLT